MMAQSAIQAGQLPATFAPRPKHAAVVNARRMPRAGRNITVAAARKDEEQTPLEPGAAFLLSLGAVMATAPAALAEAEITVPDVPPPSTEVAPVAPEAVDTAVSSVIDAVKAAGGAVKSGISIAGKGAGYVKDAADAVTPYVKKGIDVATPYVKATADVVSDVTKPVIKAAAPVVQAGVSEVEQFLNKQGLNSKAILDSTKGVTSKAEEAINAASPAVKSTAGTLSASSPATLGQYALGLIAFYYLGPPLVKGVFGSLRGYAGQISPAAALDAACNDGNAVILDIRTAIEKELAGIPDIPNSNRLIELEYVSVTDRKVRGQLRNVGAIERTMTVLQIAALKKVKKSSKILLLDKNGGQSKDIAKELAGRGYKKVFVISGGFSGWTSNKLQTKGSSSVSAVEVLGPVFGTRGTRGTKGSRGTRGTRGTRGARNDSPTRFLPSGR